jgi:hypothetical protein
MLSSHSSLKQYIRIAQLATRRLLNTLLILAFTQPLNGIPAQAGPAQVGHFSSFALVSVTDALTVFLPMVRR